MSDVRDPERDQAAPIPNDGASMHDLVTADLQERKAFGLRKYGTPLQTGNGRSFALDAYEEVLDLAVYLRGVVEENRQAAAGDPPPHPLDAVLACPVPEGDHGPATTVRGYLGLLLGMVWAEGEGFDGKRPFGNSSWEHDLYVPLIRAGLIDGTLDSDLFVDRLDRREADALIARAIKRLCGLS